MKTRSTILLALLCCTVMACRTGSRARTDGGMTVVPPGVDGGPIVVPPGQDGGPVVQPGQDGGPPPVRLPDAGIPCTPSGASESACNDGTDNDCDGYADCLDTDCEAQACSSSVGCSGTPACTAGACLCDGPAPTLPRIDNVRVMMHHDTAVIDFEPFLGARDYRIYPMPNPDDVQVGASGEYVVRNAIYRCAGDRPLLARETDGTGVFGASLDNNIQGYHRTPDQNVLGHVYLTPGAGRIPVYRVADPRAVGGYTWTENIPPAKEFNGAEYVTSIAERDRLLAMRWRDDGIAFYTTEGATRPIYRAEYDGRVSVFYTEGPEADHRGTEGERFSVLAAPAEGTVPLYRVHYAFAASHDVLAPGEERYQRVLHQGNHAMTSLSWPGLRGPTTLVIEALDVGCPFRDFYVGYEHREASYLEEVANLPTLTLDEARDPSTGEVYLNAQHEAANRPRPIARSYVEVSPDPAPAFDWYESFDVGGAWENPTRVAYDTGVGGPIFHSARFAAEFIGCTEMPAMGPMLGRFSYNADGCNMGMWVRDIEPRMARGRFLHVRMSSDIPSTLRRYPQVMITNTPLADDPSIYPRPNDARTMVRFGPHYTDEPPSAYQTIIVQPFTMKHELQVEFCDQRGWGVSVQCPRANVYGRPTQVPGHEGSFLPSPVLGELASSDRLVQFDVYASTERVYVMVDGRPAGCAVLPAGRMPEGRVWVGFGIAGYHITADDNVIHADSSHQFWRRTSIAHLERQMDDLGIELATDAPPWDESVLPCGTEWSHEELVTRR